MKNGRVIINYNICDNAKECSGISECPTGALYWDEENERIGYNKSDCIDCGLCQDACPVGAILWGEDDEDFAAKVAKVESETRTIEELNVERYGAAPMSDPIELGDESSFIEKNKGAYEYILLEYFCDDSIQCLLHSIRAEDIKALFGSSVGYQKVFVDADSVASVCEKLPMLKVVKNGEVKGRVVGYFDDEEQDSFFEQLIALK